MSLVSGKVLADEDFYVTSISFSFTFVKVPNKARVMIASQLSGSDFKALLTGKISFDVQHRHTSRVICVRRRLRTWKKSQRVKQTFQSFYKLCWVWTCECGWETSSAGIEERDYDLSIIPISWRLPTHRRCRKWRLRTFIEISQTGRA